MKKLITIAAVMMAAMFAKADTYLYWTVNMDDVTNYGATFARINGIDSNGQYYGIGDYVYIAEGGAGDTSLGSASYSNYLVTLFDASFSELAIGTAVNYSSVLSAFAYTGGAMAERPASPYSFSGFVVPEPTSGLLLLLGMGALALKRRRLR